MRWTKKMLSPCVVGLLLVIASPINGQSSQMASKENLDLPFDAFGISEDEKEAPEVVFFYGQQTLSQVTRANFKRHQINSICVGTDLTNNDKTFCQTLSRMNGGSYKHIPK